MVDPRLYCRTCKPCKARQDHRCEKLGFMGYHTGGGFAESILAEECMLYPLPDNVPLENAAVIEPLAVAVHGVKQTGVKDWADKNVLIVGAGPVGVAMMVTLQGFKPKQMIVSEPALIRRKQVSSMTNLIINPLAENVADKCLELTDGEGVDVAFDCAGVPASIEGTFNALRRGGLYMNMAVWEQPVCISRAYGCNSDDCS